MDERIYEILGKLHSELEEIKSTMATKAELQEIKSTMATKAELEEIKSTMATKVELEEIKSTMVTKAELEEIKSTMATKEDLELVVEEVKAEIQMVYDEVKELRDDFTYVEMMTARSALDIAKIKVVI